MTEVQKAGRLSPRAGGIYRWYVVVVLLLVYALAFVDRQMLGVLVGPIRRDLGLSDVQISLLLGLAFTVFYTLAGLPFGRLADAASRRSIILAGAGVWSIGTLASGMARSAAGLFAGRMTVGLGEACLNPAAVPLIADYFPGKDRGRAIGIYILGVPLGGGLANLIGGALLPRLSASGSVMLPFVGAVAPWQVILIGLGASGLLAILLVSTIREPARYELPGSQAVHQRGSYTVGEIARYLGAHRLAFATLAWAMSASALTTFGVGYWIPSFFTRSFGLGTAQAGHFLAAWGVVNLIGGAIGILGGGALADLLGRRQGDGAYRVLVVGMALLAFGFGGFALMPSAGSAVAVLAAGALGSGMLQVTGLTALMGITPNRMRAQVSALLFFIVNFIGATLGPTTIAALAEHVLGGDAMLRYAIAATSGVVSVSSLILLAVSGRSYRRLLGGKAE